MTVAVAGASRMKVLRRRLMVSSEAPRQILDITGRIRELAAGLTDGLMGASVLHTTCGLLVNEFQGALVEDLMALLERLVVDDGGYRHNDPRYSERERGNGAAHLRAGLLGHGVTVAIRAGELSLGRFQSILLAEWDGPRSRNIEVQLIGI